MALTTLDQINARLGAARQEFNVDLTTMQSNLRERSWTPSQHIDDVDAALINGAGLSFSSVPIHDVIKAMPFPVVEVHISNLATRYESTAKTSFSLLAVRGSVMGRGWRSLYRGLAGARRIVREGKSSEALTEQNAHKGDEHCGIAHETDGWACRWWRSPSL